MAGPQNKKKVEEANRLREQSKWLSNDKPNVKSAFTPREQPEGATSSTPSAISPTNAVAGGSDRASPTSSFLSLQAIPRMPTRAEIEAKIAQTIVNAGPEAIEDYLTASVILGMVFGSHNNSTVPIEEAMSSKPSSTTSTTVNACRLYDESWAKLTTDEQAQRLDDAFKAQYARDVARETEQNPQQIEEDTSAEAVTINSSLDQVQVPTVAAPAGTTATITFWDLAVTANRLLVDSRTWFNWSDMTYTIRFDRAVEIIGHENFILASGKDRMVLRPGKAFTKYAERAGLPGGIFRWLQGVLEPTLEFRYSNTRIESVIKQMTEQGIE